MRNSSVCDRQGVPIRQRGRPSQGEMTAGCPCGKLTRAAWPAPLFRDRRAPLSPEANAVQPGSQGCDSQQVMTAASRSLNPAGTCESGMAKESQARWKISPRSMRTLTPTGRSPERRADGSPTLSEGEGGKLWPESHSQDLPTRVKTDLTIARFFLTEAQGSYCTQFLMGQGEDGRKL